MADKAPTVAVKAPTDAPTVSDKAPTVSEALPSRRDELSVIASADAPILYCDWIGARGASNNVSAITLEAVRLMAIGGQVVADRVVVGHLRMPLQTMRSLRAAIDEIEFLIKTPPSTEKN